MSSNGCCSGQVPCSGPADDLKNEIRLTVACGLLGLLAFFLSRSSLHPLVGIGFYMLALGLGLRPIAGKGLSAVRQRRLDINFLMSLAVVGAAAIGEWMEATSIVFLFLLAELLESLSLGKARSAIQSLVELAPHKALVRRDGKETLLPVEEVLPRDTIIVKPAERIALDGIVREGTSTVNQSPITGESMPVEKHPGDPVYAGTINQEGALEVEVTVPAMDTVLARVVRMVEEAQLRKPSAQKFVDRFAHYYTPAVVVAAVLIATLPPLLTGAPFSSWFYRALVLLVVSCPCALVISTPVTILSGLAGAARRGVLIKGGNFLEAIGHVQVIAFDKTGTLTLGRPRVSRVLPLNSHSPAQVLQVAASLGVRSEHHLAGSIVNHAANAGIPLLSAKQVQAIPGMGVQGQVDNGSFFMGNHRFLEEKEQCNPDLEKILHHSEDRGETAVFLGSQDQVMGMITFVDTPRPGARNALDQIKECGLEVVMLTGDNRGAAEAMASQLGIDRVYYELLPENKVQVVQSLTTGGKKVAMVGDGINDAPALAASAVGIAMGGAGTHAALETADIVLMGDDLSQLPLTIRTGRRAVNIIRANIALALLIKAVFLVLTLSGLATLWMALAADMGGSLLVTANGLRLLRTRA